jgi:hypothetical protein
MAFHTLFTVHIQPLIHETAGLFPVKSEIHRKNIQNTKQQNTSLQNEKQFV